MASSYMEQEEPIWSAQLIRQADVFPAWIICDPPSTIELPVLGVALAVTVKSRAHHWFSSHYARSYMI